MTWKRTMRIAAAAAAGRLPLFPPGRGGRILCYHHVLRPSHGTGPFEASTCVREETFEKHLQWCRREYDTIPLREMLRRIENRLDLSGRVSITFDDGWEDNHSVAFPLLRKYGVPATFFLATGYIGTREPIWFSTVFKIARACGENRSAAAAVLGVTESKRAGLGQDLSQGRHGSVLGALKNVPPGETERVVNMWAEAVKKTIPGFPLEDAWMDWEQIRQMDASGLADFAPHGDRHLFLGSISWSEKRRELLVSQEKIRDSVRNVLPVFSYPGGIYGPQDQALLRSVGIRFAVTYFRGRITKNINWLELPRTGMHDYFDHPLLFRSALA